MNLFKKIEKIINHETILHIKTILQHEFEAK